MQISSAVSDLLQLVPLGVLDPKKVPLIMEFMVDRKSAPFMVLGVETWTWVPEAKKNVLRSAVRKGPPQDISLSAVHAIAKMGLERKWGNRFPFTSKGLAGAIKYVRYFGIPKVEVLVPNGSPLSPPKGVTLIESRWVPDNRAVVVPEDRNLLGMLGVFGSTFHTAAIHNPSRGMAVLGDW